MTRISFALGICAVAFAGAIAKSQESNCDTGELRALVAFPMSAPGGCISPGDQARMDAALRAYLKRTGGSGGGSYASGPALLDHFPLGGSLYRDIAPTALNDDQHGPGMFDWNCTNHCYDEHNGMDAALRSFGEQSLGIAVFAALDGVVVYTQDGYPDTNTIPAGQPSNLVYIDHGAGRQTQYYHLRKNSVTVSVGQSVRAGELIGYAGSSGNSTGPHLHFGILQNGIAFDPCTGPCNPGTSTWSNQPPIIYTLAPWDFGFSRVDLSTYSVLDDLPRTGQLALGDPFVYPWFKFVNLPANSNYRLQFKRPSGTIGFDTGVQPLNNPVAALNGWMWWQWNIAELHTITGTWTMLLDVNGQSMVAAPLEVVASFNPSFNRPPEPISLAFDPPSPTEGDSVYCRVNTSMVVDDLDYDIVRYRYLWKVNGNVVRDVTTVGQADAVPHHTALAGDVLSCSVTPGDGIANGPTANVASPVSAGCAPWFIYCTAKINSLGCLPVIDCTGTPSATSTSGFDARAKYVRNNKTGLLFYGVTGQASSPYQNGTLCVKSPIKRTPSVVSGGTAPPFNDCTGVYTIDMNAFASGLLGGTPLAALKTPGTQVNCQWWGRDPGFAAPNNTTLSDGLQYWVCP